MNVFGSLIRSVFVSSVIMYSTLPGVEVNKKLHWTPGEPVSETFRRNVCMCGARFWSRCFSGFHAAHHQHHFRVVSRPVLHQLLPHLHTRLQGKASHIRRYRPVEHVSDVFVSPQKINLRAQAQIQSNHLYESHHHRPVPPRGPTETSPLLAGSIWSRDSRTLTLQQRAATLRVKGRNTGLTV